MKGLSLKERLSEKLGEFPLLRTLLLNPWFALVFITVTSVGMGVLACLPKVWVITPPDVRPQIKVSLLDLLQARSLNGAAEQKAAQGDYLGAAAAWQSAMGNNPGDLELYRSALRHLGEAPELPMRVVSRTLSAANWMLRLGGTNRTDFEILAAAFDKYGLAEEVYSLLQPMSDDLSPELQGAYLKALFAVGRYAEFGSRWNAVQERLPQDPALELYRSAYLAGWGPPGVLDENLRILTTEIEDARHGPLACRLVMAVSRQRLDPEMFAKALQRLEEGSNDRVGDHVQYWRLLHAVGRKTEAQRLAAAFNRPPLSPYDVVVTAEALEALDMNDLCLEYLDRHAVEFGSANNRWSAAVWAAYADLLVSMRDWERLKDAATRMGAIPGTRNALGGFGRFLEGRVAYATGAMPVAEAAFEEAVKTGFPLGRVGIRVGISLLQMGYPELALRALEPLEPSLGNDLAYWRATFDAAFAWRQDEALLLKAAARAHELEPNNVEWQFNYAAALLIGRWRLEEALRLTMDLLAKNPGSVGATLNHSIALGLNGRTEDAADLLSKIDHGPLTGPQVMAYHLASVCVHAAQEDWPKVRTNLLALDGEKLFPSQRHWLDAIRQRVP